MLYPFVQKHYIALIFRAPLKINKFKALAYFLRVLEEPCRTSLANSKGDDNA